MKINKATAYMLNFLENNYLPLIDYHLNGNDKIYLGDKVNKKCRFCGLDGTATTFKNVSHAIPEFIGNKKLIAYYECDKCNSKFSRLLENHMANYMNLWHTIAQIKGKKKVPSFKTVQEKSRIDVGKESVSVQDHDGDSITTIDEDKKTITFTAQRKAYIPIAIYKTLVKMALTIMPEEELKYFKTTLNWINEDNHQNSPYNFKSLPVLMSIAPGIRPFDFVSCMLYKRKQDHTDNVPNTLFLLAYSNFVFQIYVPLCTEDAKLHNTELKMIYIPTPLDLEEVVLARQKLDMHGKDKVREEMETAVLGYEILGENEFPEAAEK